jgi:hypothetical protein
VLAWQAWTLYSDPHADCVSDRAREPVPQDDAAAQYIDSHVVLRQAYVAGRRLYLHIAETYDVNDVRSCAVIEKLATQNLYTPRMERYVCALCEWEGRDVTFK